MPVDVYTPSQVSVARGCAGRRGGVGQPLAQREGPSHAAQVRGRVLTSRTGVFHGSIFDTRGVARQGLGQGYVFNWAHAPPLSRWQGKSPHTRPHTRAHDIHPHVAWGFTGMGRPTTRCTIHPRRFHLHRSVPNRSHMAARGRVRPVTPRPAALGFPPTHLRRLCGLTRRELHVHILQPALRGGRRVGIDRWGAGECEGLRVGEGRRRRHGVALPGWLEHHTGRRDGL